MAGVEQSTAGRGRLTLVLGGVRSGKSAFAEERAGELNQPVLYLAAGQIADAAMAERIRRHRERRPAHWLTLEEPLQPAAALAEARAGPNPPGVILLDSLDAWIANLLLAHTAEDFNAVESLALAELERLLEVCRQGAAPAAFLVSSEVGLGPVPPNALGRRFQDLLGTVNQRTAAQADAVYLMVAGVPWRVKPREQE